MINPTPAQAAAHAFVTGCVARGITASMAAVPPEGQLSTVRGLWADVAAAAAGAAGEELEELRRRVAHYENAITWNTSCLSCSALLDSCYAETTLRCAAEARLAAIRALIERKAREFSAEVFPVRPEDVKVNGGDVLTIIGSIPADAARCPETLAVNDGLTVRCHFYRGHDPEEDKDQRVHDDGKGVQWMLAEPEAPEPGRSPS